MYRKEHQPARNLQACAQLLEAFRGKGKPFQIADDMLTETFQIELEQPGKEWTTLNAWFVRQLDFNVRFRRRSGTEVQ